MKLPIQINLYTRTVCPLCDKAKKQLMELASEFQIEIHEIDIYKDDNLLEKYQLMIPVIEIDGEEVDYGMINKETVRSFLMTKYKHMC